MAAPNATLVGGFVLAGIALGVGALLTFSSMHLFRKEVKVVVVFRDSVAGLSVGSAVTFRGVRIGQVENLQVRFNQVDHAPIIPVFLELDPDNVIWTNASGSDKKWNLQEAVKAGLRAQLTQESLITGILTVNLDFYPKTAPAPVKYYSEDVIDIPADPSDLEKLKDQLMGLNLPELGTESRQVLASIKRVSDALAMNIGPVAGELSSTLQTTQTAIHSLQLGAANTMTHYDKLADVTKDQVSIDGKRLALVLKNTDETMTKANAVLASVEELTGPSSPTRGDLEASLRDLAASASSLRELTHDLERHPVGVLLR